MRETYSSWPGLALSGWEASVRVPRGSYRKLYVMGLGGSAAAGDIISGWLFARHGVETEVCKGVIPANDLRGSLAVACSASGGTEETVQMMKTAARAGAKVVSISHGGALAEEAVSEGIPHVPMPVVVAPRYMLPFMVFSLIKVADTALGLESGRDVADAVSGMKRLRESISADVATEDNPSKRLALRLLGRTPVIYGTWATHGAGVRFKNAVNENAKMHASYSDLPESFHNEVQAWEDPREEFLPVLLRDETEGARLGSLADSFAKLLTGLGKEPVQAKGVGRSLLSRLMTLVYELDLASYYAAIGSGRDPFPIPLIDRLKKGG